MLSHRLVVSRFKENVDWVRSFGNYTVYNKGRDDLPSDIRPNSVRLMNVGRESHSYIHHIVDNYDNLEDVIIFSQGNYRDHLGCEPEEFFGHSMQVLEFGFGVTLPRSGHIGTNARNFVLNDYQGILCKTKFPYDLGDWWEHTTGEAYVRSRGVFWNAIFSVRSDFIRRRSRQSYQKILDTLSWSENPMEGHFCERSWFNILNLPLNFAIAHLDHESPPYIERIDASFGTEKLLERWDSCEGSKEGRRVSIRFRKSLPDISIDPLISRSELAGSLEHLRDLMLKDEVTVKKCTDALRYNIERWTRINCPSYPIDKEYVEKSDLENKEGWYVANLMNNSTEVGTTGSTSGFPFRYMRWLGTFDKIEWDYHYNFVLDEFGVRQNPNIIYFFSDHFKSEGSNPIYCTGGPSELHMNNHGTGRSPITHYVNFPVYQKDQESFFRYMFDYVREHEIDVLFTSPPQISSMCNYIRKLGVNHKIGKFLSSTGDRILRAPTQSDAKFLFLDNSYFDHVCDHMRCWDGGATFFTCKYRNYHLMDNLAWCEEGPNHELICTDYFNLASPFVRYWNGDYCKIAKEYQRCECGRLYRDFEFLESRPFSLKGTNMREIQDKIKALGIKGIKQVRCSVHNLNVVSTRDLTDLEKNMIRSVSDKFQFKFACEPF